MFIRTYYGTDLREVKSADTAEIIIYLLLFKLKLLLLWQVLPVAAAANTEMVATGILSHIRILMLLNHIPLHVVLPLPGNLYIHYIARNQHGYKHNLIINPAQGFPLCAYCCYLYLLKQWFFSSCHIDHLFMRQK